MVDIVLEEGSLSFKFTGVDYAEKYDSWQHYRNSFSGACGGSKAVDFVVLKGDVAWLIEAKDYRRHERTKPSELPEEVMEKVRDTLAGLASTRFVGSIDDEVNVARRMFGKRKLRVVLHLEQPSKPSKLFPYSVNPANVLTQLRRAIRFADFHPIVCDSVSFPTALGEVKSI
jgi:hypothetical protein